MDKIIMILGSSAFSVIITLIFKWAQKRKNASLNYITEERKVWREKIREISSKIEQCTFQEAGNIEKELVRLQMNINPYGRAKTTDYKKDAHIWSVVKKIRNAKNSDTFEKSKQLLLDYLTLMLKEDWEKSKGEVRGYSGLLNYVGIVIISLLLYGVVYFYVLKLENFTFFITVILMNLFFMFYVEYYIFYEIRNISTDRKGLTIKKILRREKRAKNAMIRFIILLVICFSVDFGVIVYMPQMVEKEIQCFKDTDSMYILSKLDRRIWSNLEDNIERYIEEDVVWIEAENELPSGVLEKTKADSEILIYAVEDDMFLWEFLCVVGLMGSWILVMYFWGGVNAKGERLRNEIERLKFNTYETYEIKCKDVQVILDRIDFAQNSKKLNAEYLGVGYSVLADLYRMLNGESNAKENSIMNIKDYDEFSRIKERKESISAIMKKIRKLGKTKKSKNQIKLLSEVRQSMSELN